MKFFSNNIKGSFFLQRRVDEGVGGVMYGNTTNNTFPHFYTTSSMYTNHPFIQYTINSIFICKHNIFTQFCESFFCYIIIIFSQRINFGNSKLP